MRIWEPYQRLSFQGHANFMKWLSYHVDTGDDLLISTQAYIFIRMYLYMCDVVTRVQGVPSNEAGICSKVLKRDDSRGVIRRK